MIPRRAPPKMRATSIATVLLLASIAACTPSQVLNKDFPDPSILKDPSSSTWYTFATAGNGNKIQMASAPSSTGPWTLLDKDPLSGAGSWALNRDTWAPDVRYLGAGNGFIMYYAAPN